ncbi:hypothetical protein BHU72_13780 [Desulfuribacillus stibiiarsenatis]|uniref:Diguanylate cyclase n=1 Tax=Desulfuribacillus stibiiarsenatis TaxID=1390249 RepID=A0A1E5L825_9FIRM|nr:EAL domain-containing protein [Desulfuribacillus stibiiarsenatis]OEH86291.1 hypothetical protein BHU72_13780 [Desulfuribacillus stibiiarsenatis]
MVDNNSFFVYRQKTFEALFEHSPDAFVFFDTDERIININRQFTNLFGYTLEDVNGENLNRILDPAKKAESYFSGKILSGELVNSEIVRYRKDGQAIPVLLRGIPVIVDNKTVGGYAVYTDLTNLIKAREEANLLLKAVENSPSCLVITDVDGNIEYVNSKFIEVTGYTADEVIGSNPRVLKSSNTSPKTYEELWQSITSGNEWRGELQNKRKNGEIYWESLSISPIMNTKGAITHFVAVKEDVTKKKELEANNYYLAYHDPLTGLANRVKFTEYLHKMIISQEDAQPFAVLFIDIDRFKNINDSIGHEFGDLLLQIVADRLAEELLPMSDVFRIGGDEFTVIVKNLDDVERIAQAILLLLTQPFIIIDKQLFITASIGISIYPKDGFEMNMLLRNADTAMYKAKEKGRNQYQYYTIEMNERAEEMLSLEVELRQAIDREELRLHFQPQIDMQTGKVIGAEALIRWQHHDRGMISPGEFIPLAEETNLIIPIGEWVIRTTCQTIRHWQEEGLQQVPVAVNISARQFMQNNFVELIERIIKEENIQPHLLDVEITESVAMEDINLVVDVLHKLNKIGVSISIDDFGTGYSSLNNFRQFPIDKLKIDQSFIRRITQDSKDLAIVTTIINLAHSLGLKVVAEGVETSEQRDSLKNYQCDMYQGFLFSRPIPIHEFNQLLASENQSL